MVVEGQVHQGRYGMREQPVHIMASKETEKECCFSIFLHLFHQEPKPIGGVSPLTPWKHHQRHTHQCPGPF